MKSLFIRCVSPPACLHNLLAAGVLLSLSLPVLAQTTQRISISTTRLLGSILSEGNSASSTLSGNARYVVFESDAANLVLGDNNNRRDVFVKDRQTGAIQRVSQASDGTEGNGDSSHAFLSADGRYVVFESFASNLVLEDNNGRKDIFRKDLETGEIQLVSTATNGTQSNGNSYEAALSADGRYVTFTSAATNFSLTDTNGQDDVYLKDLETGDTRLISRSTGGLSGNGPSGRPSLSPDGRFLVFESAANNLVANDTNDKKDVFLVDFADLFQVRRVSTWAQVQGVEGNGDSFDASISADGRYVAFSSAANNLVANDLNNGVDVFVRDLEAGPFEEEIRLVSSDSSGVHGNGGSFAPSLSLDGRYVIFESAATNLVPGDTNFAVDIFVKNLETGTTTRASTNRTGVQGNSVSSAPHTVDGRYITFQSAATNLVPGDNNFRPDVFLKDIQTGDIGIISGLTFNDGNANGPSFAASISRNGRNMAFVSGANNLIPGDTNNLDDVFVWDAQTGKLKRASTNSNGVQANRGSGFPAISGDGNSVAFRSLATNLVTGDTNSAMDIFIKNLVDGAVRRVSVATNGTQANAFSDWPSLSFDGQVVAFQSDANNLVANDANNTADVFVHFLDTNETRCVSLNSAGVPGGGFYPALSANGEYVAFASGASLLPEDTNGRIDVYRVTLATGEVVLVSLTSNGTPGNGDSSFPTISADGSMVAFQSTSTLVVDDTNGRSDIYVVNVETGEVRRISVASDGSQADGDSFYPSISDDGEMVTFQSNATNLVATDRGDPTQVYIKNTLTGEIQRVSVADDGTPGNGFSEFPKISGDGRYVVWDSRAWNLVEGDFNNTLDVFARGPFNASNYVTVSGQVTLEDLLPDAAPRLVTFTFRPTDHSGDVFLSAFVGPDGLKTLDSIPAKPYQLHIEGLQYLSVNVNVDASAGDVNNLMALLRAGDANDDDSVDVLDLDILIQAFDSTPGSPNWNPNADFNGDLSVDVLDLDILIRNFDQPGDP